MTTWPIILTHSTAATKRPSLAAVVAIWAGCSLAGCLAPQTQKIDRVAIPGEEVPLQKGEAAPYDGVLLPPGIYKGVIDEIDRRYEEIYAPQKFERKQ